MIDIRTTRVALDSARQLPAELVDPWTSEDVTKVMIAHDSPTEPQYRVRVWFGDHAIADHVAPAQNAAQYAAAMGRRFAGLRVTSDLVAPSGGGLSDVDVEDYTRPLLLGYVRRDLLVTDADVDVVKCQLSRFARIEGFAMGFTYVEQPGGWPIALEALIEAVNRYEVTAVVLPSLLHFVVLGAPTDVRTAFERATGARVMVANPPA